MNRKREAQRPAGLEKKEPKTGGNTGRDSN